MGFRVSTPGSVDPAFAIQPALSAARSHADPANSGLDPVGTSLALAHPVPNDGASMSERVPRTPQAAATKADATDAVMPPTSRERRKASKQPLADADRERRIAAANRVTVPYLNNRGMALSFDAKTRGWRDAKRGHFDLEKLEATKARVESRHALADPVSEGTSGVTAHLTNFLGWLNENLVVSSENHLKSGGRPVVIRRSKMGSNHYLADDMVNEIELDRMVLVVGGVMSFTVGAMGCVVAGSAMAGASLVDKMFLGAEVASKLRTAASGAANVIEGVSAPDVTLGPGSWKSLQWQVLKAHLATNVGALVDDYFGERAPAASDLARTRVTEAARSACK